ncbi:MAG TPA: SHOCT domain-containing protein, partial [Cyclobacteriaceae bacterium]|nr:SHOCT domain-containing protein [Cyclobacteriaceae bacterium]
KDRKVKWKTSLAEVKNSQYQNYKYSEIFYGTVSNIGHDDSKLVVVKLTDSDKNATSAKGSSVEFEGFCRAYKFKPGEIGFVLSDRLDSLLLKLQATGLAVKQPNGEKKSSDLDELKKLKELLDQGVITKSEFDAEKKKILDRRN